MMFVIATKTEKWNKALKEIQTVLHYVSGKKFYYRSFYKKYINTSHCYLLGKLQKQNSILSDTISFAGGCYYLSSTANPFLYSLLSKRFRRGFHDVLRYAFGRFFDPSIGHTQSTGAKNQGGPTQSAPGVPALSRRRGSHQKIPLQMVPLHLTHRIRSKLTSESSEYNI